MNSTIQFAQGFDFDLNIPRDTLQKMFVAAHGRYGHGRCLFVNSLLHICHRSLSIFLGLGKSDCLVARLILSFLVMMYPVQMLVLTYQVR